MGCYTMSTVKQFPMFQRSTVSTSEPNIQEFLDFMNKASAQHHLKNTESCIIYFEVLKPEDGSSMLLRNFGNFIIQQGVSF